MGGKKDEVKVLEVDVLKCKGRGHGGKEGKNEMGKGEDEGSHPFRSFFHPHAHVCPVCPSPSLHITLPVSPVDLDHPLTAPRDSQSDKNVG